MYEYKIVYEFTYDGDKRYTASDILREDSVQEAVDSLRQGFYIHEQLEIMTVYKRINKGCAGERWVLVECWE